MGKRGKNRQRYQGGGSGGGYTSEMVGCDYACVGDTVNRYKKLKKMGSNVSKDATFDEVVAQCPRSGTKKCGEKLSHISSFLDTALGLDKSKNGDKGIEQK